MEETVQNTRQVNQSQHDSDYSGANVVWEKDSISTLQFLEIEQTKPSETRYKFEICNETIPGAP